MDPDLLSLLGPMGLTTDEEGADAIARALAFARSAHEGQWRKSGEPYIVHPIGVARITAELGGDVPAVVAALLHDTVEDTGVSLTEIAKRFSPLVAEVVDGLTKLDRLDRKSVV